jgi:hypothetical protein
MKAFKPKLDVNRDGNGCEESALGGGCEGPELDPMELVVMTRNSQKVLLIVEGASSSANFSTLTLSRSHWR